MVTARRLLIALLLLTAAWASQPRASMVLSVKGAVTAADGAKASPLRTLQVLPQDLHVALAKGAELRLTYLTSGLRETATGPLKLSIGADRSTVISGEGKLMSEPSAGGKTMVPKSDNLRRMGGARQAMLDADLEGLLAKIPNNSHSRDTVRGSHTLKLDQLSPILTDRQDLTLSWRGGAPPYAVSFAQNGGKVLAFSKGSKNLALALPDLSAGASYVLTVKDAGGETIAAEVYRLSAGESDSVEQELGLIEKEAGDDDVAALAAQISYLQELALYDHALILARRAVDLFPDDVGLRIALGRIQLLSGLYSEAYETLYEASLPEDDEP